MRTKRTRKPFYSQVYRSWIVPLTQGVIALVDPDMVSKLAQHNWRADKQDRRWRALRNNTEQQAGRNRKVLMHHAVMAAEDGFEIDHIVHRPINDKVIDNRRANLRLATHPENSMNQRPQIRETSSRFKGVCWDREKGKWRAYIRANKKLKYLGHFCEETKAACAYDAAAVLHHGDFASTNESAGLL